MTKTNRKNIQLAAQIIAEELKAGRKIRIPGFGLFYTADVLTSNDYTRDIGLPYYVRVVKFRPWKKLKREVCVKTHVCGKTERWSIFPKRCAYKVEHDGKCSWCE